MNEEETILTVKEAAEFLRLHTNYIYQLKAQKKIPYHTIGSKVLFFKSELITWLKAQGQSA